MTDELRQMLDKAKAQVAAMSPEEYAAMIDAQRESWVRAMAPCEHGVADWETCAACRQPQSDGEKGE